MKSLFQKYYTEMYSTDNEEKSVVGKRFIKLEGFMKKTCKRQIKQSLN